MSLDLRSPLTVEELVACLDEKFALLDSRKRADRDRGAAISVLVKEEMVYDLCKRLLAVEAVTR